VGTPSAEGARIEAPQALRGAGCGEGVSPSPPGEGSLPRKILKFSSQNGEFWCNMKCYLQRLTTCFYTQIETSTAHSTVPYHNTIYAYLSHIQFLVRKSGCIWVLTSSCTVFAPFRDSAKILPKPKADLGAARGPCPPKMPNIMQRDTEQHNPGVHCNKKRHQWHQIMPFIFTWPSISGCVL